MSTSSLEICQVEMVKRPEYLTEPLGVRQKQLVVTCNYPARARGVTKCMSVREAFSVCPELFLVCGEDLAEYRRVSAGVTQTLAEAGCAVERLGMDENWVDVTEMVEKRLAEGGGGGTGGSATPCHMSQNASRSWYRRHSRRSASAVV